MAAPTTPKTQIMAETEYCPVSFFLAPYGNLLLSPGAQGQRPRNHKYFFLTNVKGANWPVYSSTVFKTPTKLQHPYCNSFEAIAIGKLDLVLDRRNVSLFRDLATEPIFTLRISQPLNIFFVLRTFSSIRSIGSISTSCMVLLKVKYRQRFYRGIDMLWG